VSALRAFLGELIDDASLFPPAALSLPDALAANERAAAGPEFWMLGRFVVPAGRVAELARLLDDSPDPLPCSAIVDAAAAALEFANLARHADEFGDRIAIEALETRLVTTPGTPSHARVATLAAALDAAGWRERPSLFVEIGPHADLEALFANLREERDRRDLDVCAKLRCGGSEPEATPSPEEVARFIAAARDAGVPFKATAGLHHPFRKRDGASGRTMHGFINVAGAAVLASLGADAATLGAVVADENPADFRLDAGAFSWQNVSADRDAVGTARMRGIRSYGSCSFVEPIEDLQASGILSRA